MTIHEASRTLLKSPPELWAECSDARSLSRHLDQFGEIKITRLEPETAVAWEGETVSGTVKLEPAGWGTRVILTAEAPEAIENVETVEIAELAELAATAETAETAEAPTPAPPVATLEPDLEPPAALEPDPEPPATAAPPAPVPKLGFLARMRGKWRRSTELAGKWPQVEPSQPAAPAPVDVEPTRAPEPTPARQPTPAPEPPAALEPEPQPDPTEPPATVAALTDALESLGMAHHRPFSRS